MSGLKSIFSRQDHAEGWTDADPTIELENVSMLGKHGVVYDPVTLTVPSGGILVACGPEGSGKTAFLLSVCGRMRFTSGLARVRGLNVATHAAQVRRLSALAHVEGVTDLEENLRVDEHVAERAIMLQKWYRPWVSKSQVKQISQRTQEVFDQVTAWFDAHPDLAFSAADVRDADFTREVTGKRYVGELGDLQQFFLELALAGLSRTPVIGIDNIDFLRTRRDRVRAWLGVLFYQKLAETSFGLTRPTLVVTCEDASELRELLENAPESLDLGPVHLLDMTRASVEDDPADASADAPGGAEDEPDPAGEAPPADASGTDTIALPTTTTD